MKFTPSEDGDYFLRVKDQLNQGGMDYVYRVEITPAQPGVAVSIPQVARNDSQTRQYIVIPKGNRFATLISAKRANFSGDLDLSIEGLPEGVTLHCDNLPAKVDAFPLVFEASSEARLSGKLYDFTARLAGSSNTVPCKFRHQVELVQGPNNTYYYGTQVDKLYVGVAIVAVVVIAATRGRLGYTAPTTGAATPMAVDRAVPMTAPDGTS